MNARGVTLTEVIIGSVLAFFVVIAITTVDTSRVQWGEAIRKDTTIANPEQMRVAMATMHLTQRFERADRVVIWKDGTAGQVDTDVQVRVPEIDTNCPAVGPACPIICNGCVGAGVVAPAPCCFDIPGNYRWDEYRLKAGAIEYLSNTAPVAPACAPPDALAREVKSFTIQFVPEAAPPQGGDPPPAVFTPGVVGDDTNVIGYTLEWDNGLVGPDHRYQNYPGKVILRETAYTDLGAGSAGTGDSGTGLSAAVGGPPPQCN